MRADRLVARASGPHRRTRPALLALSLLALLLAAVPTHAGIITGRVVTTSGAPVPGVDIDVENLGSGGDPDIFNDGTDANGFFTTTVQQDGTYEIIFNPPPPPATTSLTRVLSNVSVSGTVNLGTIVLPDGAALSATLVDSIGAPVGGVNIDSIDPVTGASFPLKNDTSSVFGVLNLVVPLGPQELRFKTAGVFGRTLAPMTLDINPSGPLNLGTVVLEDGYVLSAVLTNPAGTPLGGIDIDVDLAGTGQPVYAPGDDSNALGLVDVVLAAGTYDVSIDPPPALGLVSQFLPNLVVNADTNLGIIPLQAGFRVSGTITAGGVPFQGADIDVEDALGADIPLGFDTSGVGGAYAIVVPPGTWTLRVQPPAGLPYAPVEIPNFAPVADTVLNLDMPDCPLPCGPTSILSVSPVAGHPAGGTRVTLVGDNYRNDGSITVSFGGVPGTVVQVIEPDRAIVDTPPGPTGTTVDVSLDSSNGPSLLVGGFTYTDPPPPVVTNVNPSTALFNTTTEVTLTGQFDPLFPAALTVGGREATDVVVVDATTITCRVPPGIQGELADIVLVQDNDEVTVPASFSWFGNAITSIEPSGNHPTLETAVVITGSPFARNTKVFLDGAPAVVTSQTPTTLEILVPPGASGDALDVGISGWNGVDTLVDGFVYDDPPPPVVLGVEPPQAIFDELTPVTITGTDFDPYFDITVTFGGKPATDVVRVDAQTITCTAPLGALGEVGDVVVTQDGESSVVVNGFRWVKTTLSNILPATGHPLIETPVLITGAFFHPESTVTFNGVPAPVLSITETRIETLVPPGAVGTTTDLTVSGLFGEDSLVGAFGWVDPPAPTLLSSSPNNGLFHSPTPITLSGVDFDEHYPISVIVGGFAAGEVTWVSGTTVTAVVPPHLQGVVGDVVLEQNGFVQTLPSAFRWVGTKINSLTPAQGHPLVSTPVTLTGNFFAPDTTVSFGGTPGTVVSVTDSSLEALAPPGPPGALVDVVATGTNGTDTLAGGFGWIVPVAPTLTAVGPESGLFHTPTPVTLTGTDFDPHYPITVTVGGLAATDVERVSDTEVTAVVPAHVQGAVGDVVLTQNGHVRTLPGAFTWFGSTLTSIDPAVGHPLVGAPVTLTGSAFGEDTTVSFGGTPGTVTSVTDTVLEAVAPPGSVGTTVDVTVDGTNGTDTLMGAFGWVDPPAPTLAGVEPDGGLFHSPTAVTLTGTDFDEHYPISVTVGGLAATEVVRVSDTEVTALVPANVQGAVGDVVLTQNGHVRTLPGAFTWFGTTLTGLFPPSGHPAGGTEVTLEGAFIPDDGSAVVTVGGVGASVLSVTAPDRLVFATPAGTSGATVDVSLTTSDGTDTLVAAYRYEDTPPPTLSAVVPAKGIFLSPTNIQLNGNAFDAVFPVTVTVGGLPCTNVVRVSETVVTATVPVNVKDAVGDVVLEQNGVQAVLTDGFTWVGTTLTSVEPASGHPLLETPVVVSGEFFHPNTTVSFGGTPGTVTSVSPTEILVVAPPGPGGTTVDVTASGTHGDDTLVGAFSWIDPPAPTLSAISPDGGLFHSPTPVTLTGTDFDPHFPISVTVGGLAATEVVRVSDTEVTALVPANAQGSVGDVILTQNGHVRTLPGAFTWFGTVLADVSPDSGHPLVETPVTLSGELFAPDTTVSFGGTPGTVRSVTPTTLEALAPPGPAGTTVDVTVSGADGTSTLPGAFGWIDPPAPTLASVSPDGGLFHSPTPVTLTGTDFDEHYAISVTVGGLAATQVVRVSDTEVIAVVPANAQGTVGDVVLTQNGHVRTLPDAFTWFGTVLADVSPASGHPLVETPVTLTGERFAPGTTVSFGGTPATVVSVSETVIEALAPPGPAGTTVDVTVAGDDGTDTLPGAFGWIDPPAPTLTAISPDGGLFHSPTPVTLTGTDFDEHFPITVTVGGLAATEVVRVSATEVTAVVPANAVGVGDVVLTQNGHVRTLPGAFTWFGATIASVFPPTGHPAGGTQVTITGTALPDDGSVAVTVGGLPATVLQVDAPTSVLFSTPAGTSGQTVDIALTSSNGDALLPGAFAYEDTPPPTLSSILPERGLFHTPTQVEFRGNAFDAVFPVTITVGGLPATNIVRVSENLVTATVPAHVQGAVGDVVLEQNGVQAVLTDAYSWVGTTLAELSPTSGHPLVETPVTLTGEFFAPDTTVSFGGLPATVVSVTPTSLDVVAPPGPPGTTVDVTATGSDGTDTLPGAFTWFDPPAPTLASVSPGEGLFTTPTPVTLGGSDFDEHFPIAVTAGGLAATDVSWVSATEVTATVPAHLQGVMGDVVLTQNGNVQTLPGAFTWVGSRLDDVSPSAGHPLLETPVTLTGALFAPDTTVSFGGTPGTVLGVTDTSITALAPAGPAGTTVDVTVSGSQGTDTLVGGFGWIEVPAPTLTGIAPGAGLFTASTAVTLTGTDFDEHYPLAVTVGGLDATDVVRLSDTEVTATVPANAQGAVGDVVLTQNGHVRTLPDGFRWIGTSLAGVNPPQGHPSGGETVTLSGDLLPDDGSLVVTFGGAAATVVSVTAPGSAEVLTPPGAGGQSVDVVVSGSQGTDTLTDGFTYVDLATPFITDVSPDGGLFRLETAVTLTGGNFDPQANSLTVSFDGVPATQVTFVSPTTVTAVAPVGLQGQVVDVVLEQDGQVSTLPAAFTYLGTTVTSVTPDSGHPAVQTPVTVRGTFFAPGSELRFGGVPATVQLVAGDRIEALAPTGTAGQVVDVTVTGDDGTGTLVGGFTYDLLPPPVITSVEPEGALFNGPAAVTLRGTGFDEFLPLAVSFGGQPATDVVRVSATELTCTAPAGPEDARVDVVVTQDGQSGTLTDGWLWFGSTIASLSPAGGHPQGGTSVTLTGEAFATDGSTEVFFGGVPATDVTELSPTSVKVSSPAGPGGEAVDVEVRGSNGSDVLVDGFLYDDPSAPVLTSIDPAEALFNTATPVTLTGAGFDTAPQAELVVRFGGVEATDVAVLSTTQIACTAPTGAQGETVDVTVTQNGATSTLPGGFRYVGARILSVSPTSVPPVGGEAVTIEGTFLPDDGSLVVRFGALEATLLSVNPPDAALVQVPVGTPGETVDVSMTSSNGEDLLVDAFTFAETRLLTITPATGPAAGGPPVTFTGEHFADDGSLELSFGGLLAEIVSVTPTELVVELPAGNRGSVVDVVLTSTNGTSTLEGAFAYALTRLAEVTPALGPPEGGDVVDLLGEDFVDDGSTQVFFGETEATVLSVEAPHTITVVTPAGAPDAVVPVRVESSNGTDELAAAYRYGDMLVEAGDGLDGALDPGDTDTLFFEGLAGERVSLQLQRVKGSDLMPGLRLTAPDGQVIVDVEDAATKGTTARVKNLTLPQTGRYTVELLATEGTQGAYRYRTKVKPVKKLKQTVQVNGATPVQSVRFGAREGWVLTNAKVSGRKTKSAPDLLLPALVLRAPDGTAVPLADFISTNASGSRVTLKQVPLDMFGDWFLDVRGADGTSGDARVALKLKAPKTKGRRLVEE